MTVRPADIKRLSDMLYEKIKQSITAFGVGQHLGFTLVLFDVGKGGSMTYVSTHKNTETLKLLRELVKQMRRNEKQWAQDERDRRIITLQ